MSANALNAPTSPKTSPIRVGRQAGLQRRSSADSAVFDGVYDAEAHGLVSCAIKAHEGTKGSFPETLQEFRREARRFEQGKVTVYHDLVKVSFKGEQQRTKHPKDDGQPATRGTIKGFSRKSRKRLLEAMACTRGLGQGLFTTLTFPDSWVQDEDSVNSGVEVVPFFDDLDAMYEDAHRCLKVFLRRLERQYPSAKGWWKMEIEDRKSGRFKGMKVPHFHLLIFGMEGHDLIQFRLWVARVWFEVVGTKDPDHLKAGTEVDHIRNKKHAYFYAGKYSAKEADRDDRIEAGRRWGEFGDLDKSESLQVSIDGEDWIVLRRLLVRWLKARGTRGATHYAKRFAGHSPHVGGSVFGAGDTSNTTWVDVFDSTIFRMVISAGGG